MYGIDSNKTKNISYKKIIQVQTGVNILAKIPDAFLFHPRGGALLALTIPNKGNKTKYLMGPYNAGPKSALFLQVALIKR